MKGGRGGAVMRVAGVVLGGARPRRPKSANGRLIEELMKREKARGSHKDWCVVSGARLIDHRGAYDLEVAVPGVKLVHKKDLWRLVGEEFAGRFWSRKLGVRLNGPAPAVSEGM